MTRDDEAPTLNEKRKRNAGWANLRPAGPGEVRNPRGRAAGRRYLSEAYADALSGSPDDLDLPAPTAADAVASAIVRKAMSGSTFAAQELGDRTEGKPGVRGVAGVGVVGVLLSLPPRDTPLDELPGALEASTADLRAALLAEARGALPAPTGEGVEGPGERSGD